MPVKSKARAVPCERSRTEAECPQEEVQDTSSRLRRALPRAVAVTETRPTCPPWIEDHIFQVRSLATRTWMGERLDARRGAFEIVLEGSRAFEKLFARAAAECGARIALDGGYEGRVVVVAGRRGPDLVAPATDGGALGVLGVASAANRGARRALLDAGAADVVSPRCDAWELARRLERVARIGRLAHRVEEGVVEIESQRALFQAVIDSIPFSLYAIDRDYRVVVWNRGREAGPFGRPRQSVLGESIFGAVGEQARLREEFAEVFESGLPRITEVEGSAGGPQRMFRVEKIPMRLGSADEITHVINFARDVTAQRRMERTMAQAEKLAAVGRLAAGIAHEINNPLATIAGTAEALRYALSDAVPSSEGDELAQDAKVIEEEAYRCKEILQSLLDFSRSPSGESESVDLAWVAKRTVRLLRHNPKLARNELRLELADESVSVLGNENALVEALMALILNAADATPEGSIVVSATVDESGRPRLGVSDDGPGIPADIRERICEPFFTTKPPGQGTGLGLSVVYGLVQAHEGELDIQSSPGAGSRFTMVFPFHRESVEREEIEV